MFNVADSWVNVYLKHQTSHQGAKNSTRMISWSPILLSKSLSVNSSTSLACAKPASAAKTISLSIVASSGLALLRSQQKGLRRENSTGAVKAGDQPTEAEREQADLERERDGSGEDIQACSRTSPNHCVAAFHWPISCVTLRRTANQSEEQETRAPQSQLKPKGTPLKKSRKWVEVISN